MAAIFVKSPPLNRSALPSEPTPIVVVGINQHGDLWVGFDVRNPFQFPARFGFAVDGDPDRAFGSNEYHRHDVRLVVDARGEMRDRVLVERPVGKSLEEPTPQ